MSQDEADQIVGRAAREIQEAKRRLESLKPRAAAWAERLEEIASALRKADPSAEYDDSFLADPADVRNLIREIDQLEREILVNDRLLRGYLSE